CVSAVSGMSAAGAESTTMAQTSRAAAMNATRANDFPQAGDTSPNDQETSPSPAKERRSSGRLRVNEVVHFRRGLDALGLGCLRNVSLSGAYCESGRSLPSTGRVRLRLTSLDALVRGEAWVEAHVVRRASAGVGLQWCLFGPPPIRSLLAWQNHTDGSG